MSKFIKAGVASKIARNEPVRSKGFKNDNFYLLHSIATNIRTTAESGQNETTVLLFEDDLDVYELGALNKFLWAHGYRVRLALQLSNDPDEFDEALAIESNNFDNDLYGKIESYDHYAAHLLISWD